MDLGLVGRRAFVTASTGGIGAAVARRLAAEGAAVVVHGRDEAKAHALAHELRQAGADAAIVVGELGEPGSGTAVTRAAIEGGEIDILVANAGPFREDRLLDASAGDWMEAFRTNTVSAIECMAAALPAMMQRGWGRIITLGTRAVTTPLANMATYSAAKAALTSATAVAAQETAGTGVTANVVSPGVILTESLQAMFDERARGSGDDRPWAEREAEVVADYAPNPVGRLGRPDDVAAAVAFLASSTAAYTTGSTLRVDGGITRTVS